MFVEMSLLYYKMLVLENAVKHVILILNTCCCLLLFPLRAQEGIFKEGSFDKNIFAVSQSGHTISFEILTT